MKQPITKEEGIVRLEALENTLPADEGNIDALYGYDFHKVLDGLTDGGYSVGQFVIPPTEFIPEDDKQGGTIPPRRIISGVLLRDHIKRCKQFLESQPIGS